MTVRQWHLPRGHQDGGTGTLALDRPVSSPAEPAAEAQPGRRARRLGVIGLALVLISAMDSIRNLPTTATFGWSAIFFYGIAVLTYLVPVALCSAELATTVGGGMYRWVREALGSRWGFLAVWCDWRLLLPRDQERQAHLPRICPGGRDHRRGAVHPGQHGHRDGGAR